MCWTDGGNLRGRAGARMVLGGDYRQVAAVEFSSGSVESPESGPIDGNPLKSIPTPKDVAVPFAHKRQDPRIVGPSKALELDLDPVCLDLRHDAPTEPFTRLHSTIEILAGHAIEIENVVGAEGQTRRLKPRLGLSLGDAPGGVEGRGGG